MKMLRQILTLAVLVVSPVFTIAGDSSRTPALTALSDAAGSGVVDQPGVKHGVYDRVRWFAGQRAKAAAPPQLPMQEKKWTVMVFNNGANNLAGAVLAMDLEQMSSVGSTDNMNLVLEMGLASGSQSLVQRMLLLPASRGKKINPVIYSMDVNRDMGAWNHVADFVQWAKKNFPARRYMLIIQNHGAGVSGISFDDTSGNTIKISQFTPMFKRAGFVDIFLMNACLMQMLEVDYQIGPNAGVIVGSEEVDAAWFQHEERLGYLNAHPDDSAESISSAFVDMRDKARNALSGYRLAPHATLSAVRTSELKNLSLALDAWVGAVVAADEPAALRAAIESVIRFNGLNETTRAESQFADLGDFASILSGASRSPEVKDATGNLLDSIKKSVVKSMGTQGHKEVAGISIRMIPRKKPQTSAAPPDKPGRSFVEYSYTDMRLIKAGGRWGEFLGWAEKIYYQP